MQTVLQAGNANLEPKLSTELISYLHSSNRTPASEFLLGAMIGIPNPDSSKLFGEQEPTSLRDLVACRMVMRTPEARGRLDDMARLGGRWTSVAAFWDELCAIHDEEHQSSVELTAPRTAGSLTWVLVSGRPFAMPEIDALVIAQNPGVSLDGWLLCLLQRGFIETADSYYELGPDVMMAGYAKFGCPCRAFFYRLPRDGGFYRDETLAH